MIFEREEIDGARLIYVFEYLSHIGSLLTDLY
jgi:hypothetical protein